MNSEDVANITAGPTRSRLLQVLAGVFLFSATALVVVWQNSRLAVLWDLSYTLENSYRISLGDIPYRDFPFAHAPLTFLIQAAIIKLAGRVYWHHVAYCAISAGAATVLSWRILRNVLRGTVRQNKLIGFLLSLPLIPLGIYCVFPHPFYDPDCTLAILLGIFLLQRIDRKPSSNTLPLLAGFTLVIPLFVKQNTGLACLLVATVLLIAMLAFSLIQKQSSRLYVLTLTGVALGLSIAVLLIRKRAGLGNYWHWTMQFAAARRTPARAEMLEIYADKMVLVWLAFCIAGLACIWLSRQKGKAWALVGGVLIAIPFIWPAIYVLRDSDASERADRLLGVWPVLLIFSFLIAVATIKRRQGFAMVIPFIVLAAINGAFMSQQLWGSTYAIWPLFMILVAMTLSGLAAIRSHSGEETTFAEFWLTMPLTLAVAISLVVAGGLYVRSHERLEYANLDEGDLKRSTLPALKGLSTRGKWIPTFEELVAYVEQKIPRDEGILILPGEDPFYYATGRRPQFPVLLFDHTVNPYSPDEILQIARERNIRWVIIKQDLQDEDEPTAQELDRLTEAVEQDFEQIESLGNYDIYHRIDPNKKDEDDDDDDSK
jgi:hypothetical protein